jgi:predicted ATPase/DNA-binding CsgD family transcriptional regulator
VVVGGATRRSGDETWSRVPVVGTPLFGREAEVAEVVDLVTNGAPLVTITGQGGIGKTRVALEAARRLGYRLLFLQLADLHADDLATAVFAAIKGAQLTSLTGLDVPLQAGTVLARHSIQQQHSIEQQRSIGQQRVLLLLDTFDRLHDADQLLGPASVIGLAQRADPDLVVLATSRARLALRFERVLPLTGLAVHPGGPAEQMFRERSKAAGGDLGESGQEAAITAVCRQLRGVPLAIELAAGRTTLLPPAALLARMGSAEPADLLGVLANGPVDAPARHRSIRAATAWSYQLLRTREQALLRRLGVFTGSFNLHAAESVCVGVTAEGASLDRERVLDAISALVELHLVEPSNGDPELPRFTLLEAPRAYAIELLEMSGELDDVRARMYEWCLGFAERAGHGLASAQERRWLDLVEAELPTIRTTLAALAKSSDVVRGVALVTAVAELWIQRGPIREAMTWLRTFLDIDHVTGRLSAVDRGMAVCWMQRLRQESGEPPQLDELRRARASVVNAGCAPAQFHRSTDHLVSALLLGRDPAECTDLIDAGTRLARESDDSYWLSLYLFRRAYLHWTKARGGLMQRAVPYVEEALEVARANGHRRVAARSASLLGLCRVAERDWRGAQRAMTAALADLREIGDRPATVSALQCLGTIHIELGDPAGAGSWLRDAIVETRRIGYGLGELYCTWGVAFLAARAGRSDDAVRMDDALNDHLAAVQPGLPEVLVADYTAAMIRSRTAAGAGPRTSGGHGWGWLRNRALEVAAEIAESAMAVGAAVPAAGVIQGASALGVAGARMAQRGRTNGSGPRPELTARELEILAAIASGRTNAQIAKDLFLSAKTVMHHSTSIYRKLAVGGRAEAVALAYRTGLLQSPGG